MNDTQRPQGSWWHSFPGTLTAIAGFLSALGGLLVVLHQVGMLGGAEKQAAASKPPVQGRLSAAPAPASGASGNPSSKWVSRVQDRFA